MINTYMTSMAPPPVPPRHSRSHSVLIPAPLPSKGHSKTLVRFLVGVVLMHLFLSVGGFIYLYQNDKSLSVHVPSGEGKTAPRSSGKQDASYRPMARMAVTQRSHSSAPGNLQWEINHSVHRSINYYNNSWLTILQPGDYYVYSRVTFSKGDSVGPLVSRVKMRKNEKGEEKVVMVAYCNLDSASGSALSPQLCTASQGETITLEKGNQLSVWVQDLSLVNYEEGATTFGMYKL
ncbi:CD40 ligand [Cottoperca gobio]|uniref:CD40 ligand n=1 Tax=Cottoperca gobio TaxID=56716 RepID=A0A6J2QJG8_COTGO|nr:tumor necrosis factor ligand superfamily member 6-like [Cottoperca gobio]